MTIRQSKFTANQFWTDILWHVKPPLQVPQKLPGLQLWIPFDHQMYQDAGMTTPAVANNDPIGNAPDLSGNGNDAVFGGASPGNCKLATNAVNGLNSLNFDVGGAFLVLSSPITLSGAFTVYAVGKISTLATDNWLPIGSPATGAAVGYSGQFLSGSLMSDDGFDVRIGGTPSTPGAIAWRFRKTSGNAGVIAATGLPSASPGNLNQILTFSYIGASAALGFYSTAGDFLCEIAVCNQDVLITDPQADADMLAYMLTKWGTPIP